MSCSEEAEEQHQEKELDIKEQSHDQSQKEQEQSDDEKVLDKNEVMTWKLYHNERFDFCVDYPRNFLAEIGESENHDGNIFATANKSSEMRASGIFNVLEETIEEAFESATKNNTYYVDEQIISYKQQKDNWFVVSGNYNESIFYVRTILEGDTFYTLYFEYHSSEKERFKEIIEHTTQDFPKCQSEQQPNLWTERRRSPTPPKQATE